MFQGTNKKGEIELEFATVEKMNEQNKYHFIIHTKTEEGTKDFILSAHSDEECNNWIDAINAAIQSLKEENSYIQIMTKK